VCVLVYARTHTHTTWVFDVSPGVGRTPGEPEKSRSPKAQCTCRPYMCTKLPKLERAFAIEAKWASVRFEITWPGYFEPDRSPFSFGSKICGSGSLRQGHFSRSPVRTLAHQASAQWYQPSWVGNIHTMERSGHERLLGNALVKKRHHYQIGFLRDLAM